MSRADPLAHAAALLARGLPLGAVINALRREDGLSGREARRVVTEARAQEPEVREWRTATG